MYFTTGVLFLNTFNKPFYISCLIVLTHSYFFSFGFSFVLHEICQTPATEPGNYYNLCMQIISQSKWVEGKNLILKFPVFHPFLLQA